MGIRTWFAQWVRVRIWRMDIHKSARIDPTALIDRTWPKGVHIAEGCVISAQAVVLTHDFTRGVYLDTWIGARSYLGPRAIVLPGVRVGEDCVIMPGALVTRDVPPGSRVIGNPGEIRQRDEADT